MDGEGSPAGWVPAKPPGHPVARAAFTAALVWFGVGAALSALASTAPHPDAAIPKLLAYGAILAGWPIGRWSGRRAGLRTRGDWARLWAGTFAILALGLGFIGCAVAIGTYG